MPQSKKRLANNDLKVAGCAYVSKMTWSMTFRQPPSKNRNFAERQMNLFGSAGIRHGMSAVDGP